MLNYLCQRVLSTELKKQRLQMVVTISAQGFPSCINLGTCIPTIYCFLPERSIPLDSAIDYVDIILYGRA
jgi:hypothetical protein